MLNRTSTIRPALAIVLIMLGAGGWIALGWGPYGWVAPWEIWNGDSEARIILLDLRLPRIVLALLVGANLALAGVVMQALFNNPMAEPYVVGVSAGAALGAVLVLATGVSKTLGGLNLTAVAALTGAWTAGLVVYLLARRGGRVPVETLLLTGIAVSTLLVSITTYLLLKQDFHELRSALFWLLGGLAYRGWDYVLLLLPYSVIGWIAVAVLRRDLDVLAQGETAAFHLGMPVERTKAIFLLVASLLAASTVAAVGIVAFVGLIVPHLGRLLGGPGHRRLIPLAAVLGGTLLLWADLLARWVAPGEELPLGIITGAAGAVFFLVLLSRRHSTL